MNAKRAKALRKYLRSVEGSVKPLETVGRNNKTLKNPEKSHQALYPMMKTSIKKG